jgi:hypothetical protein
MTTFDPSDYFSNAERHIWEEITDSYPDLAEDRFLQSQFHTFMDPHIGGDLRAAAYDGLRSYMDDYYSLDFDDVMDWDAYQEWYDSL